MTDHSMFGLLPSKYDKACRERQGHLKTSEKKFTSSEGSYTARDCICADGKALSEFSYDITTKSNCEGINAEFEKAERIRREDDARKAGERHRRELEDAKFLEQASQAQRSLQALESEENKLKEILANAKELTEGDRNEMQRVISGLRFTKENLSGLIRRQGSSPSPSRATYIEEDLRDYGARVREANRLLGEALRRTRNGERVPKPAQPSEELRRMIQEENRNP
jgi:hypothetical protein